MKIYLLRLGIHWRNGVWSWSLYHLISDESNHQSVFVMEIPRPVQQDQIQTLNGSVHVPYISSESETLLWDFLNFFF